MICVLAVNVSPGGSTNTEQEEEFKIDETDTFEGNDLKSYPAKTVEVY
jgi:hypothetical protein